MSNSGKKPTFPFVSTAGDTMVNINNAVAIEFDKSPDPDTRLQVRLADGTAEPIFDEDDFYKQLGERFEKVVRFEK